MYFCKNSSNVTVILNTQKILYMYIFKKCMPPSTFFSIITIKDNIIQTKRAVQVLKGSRLLSFSGFSLVPFVCYFVFHFFPNFHFLLSSATAFQVSTSCCFRSTFTASSHCFRGQLFLFAPSPPINALSVTLASHILCIICRNQFTL